MDDPIRTVSANTEGTRSLVESFVPKTRAELLLGDRQPEDMLSGGLRAKRVTPAADGDKGDCFDSRAIGYAGDVDGPRDEDQAPAAETTGSRLFGPRP